MHRPICKEGKPFSPNFFRPLALTPTPGGWPDGDDDVSVAEAAKPNQPACLEELAMQLGLNLRE